MRLVDANNKEFNVSISDITDMTTDLEGDFKDHNISDAERHNLASFKPEIVDSNGKEVDVSLLLDEKKEGSTGLPKAIDVLFEATHSGRNRNSFVYHSESMEKDTYTWKTPFAKPFLKNHDMYSEPLGRVRDAYFDRSELNPDRDTINVSYRISDADAIEKFLDGRYQTMSIGASVNRISCNICGKEILKDGIFKFCGHWRGEVYNNQEALWNGRDIEYKEGSVVNNPADDWAQVKRITVINGDAKDSVKDSKQEGEDLKDKSKDNKDSVVIEDNVLDDIDMLVAEDDTDEKEDEKKDNTAEPNEGEDKEENSEGESKDVNSDSDDEESSEEEEDDKDIKKALEDAEAEIITLKESKDALEKDNKELEAKIEDFEKEVEGLKDQIRTLTEENKASAEDSQESRKQSIKLAVLHKKLLAQRAVDFELVNGELEDNDKEARLDELIKKSTKELSDMSSNVASSTIKKQRVLVDQINNPGGINPKDEHSITDEGEEVVKIDEGKTLKDFEDAIMKIITR